jgi:NAD(P)-dependent dehydrogenase (short-subunit alcohol dehydrogenase family)
MSAVVITGAAGDLGRALSASFLADGCTVFGADVAAIEPCERLIPVALDVTDRAGMFALAERAAEGSGGLSIWINGAGIVRVTRSWKPILTTGSGSSRSTSPALFTAAQQRSRS